MLLSFILGSMITRFKVPIVMGVIIIMFFLIILVQYILKISNRYINSQDKFLIFLPLLLYLGFILMTRRQLTNPMDHYFDDKIMGNINGTVSMIVDKGDNSAIYLKNNQIKISKNSRLFHSNQLILYSNNTGQLKIGNKIKVYGEIRKFKPASNYGQFDEESYNKIKGIDYKVYEKNTEIIDQNYNRLKQGLYQLKLKLINVYSHILNEKNAGIISAMLLGEKSLLGEDIKDLYKENGIAHILAISGFHVSFIGLTFYKIFNSTGLNQIATTLISTFFIYCYGVITNFSVSTNRAVIMLIVSLFANVFSRTYDLLSSLSFSALLILICNPMEIYDVGFLLSFGAVLGIGVIVPVFRKFTDHIFTDILKKYKTEEKILQIIKEKYGGAGEVLKCFWKILKREKVSRDFQNEWKLIKDSYHKLINKQLIFFLKGIIDSLLLCFCINLITIPFLLYFFYELPVYSLIVNLFIIPPMSLLLFLSILGGIGGCFNRYLGAFFIGGAHYILELYQMMCEFFRSLPGHMLIVGKPAFFQIIIYYVILISFIFLIKKTEKKRCFLILLLLLTIFIRKDPKGLNMTFLDVSQGDGIYIQSDTGKNYLIDGGSSDVSQLGKYRLEPFLKAKGIRTIDYAFMTHADFDHISGLKELLGEETSITIKHLILPNISYIDEAYEELVSLAKENNTKVIYIEKGDVIRDGRLSITCLHPTKEYISSSRNDYSTVLSMEYEDFKGLFVGDLEKGGENMILDATNEDGERMLLDYDLLKVAHHGSKSSSQIEFLNIVLPEISIISCGKNNSYGHPNEEVLERLQEIDSKIYITMDSGAITVNTDGKRMGIKEYLKN